MTENQENQQTGIKREPVSDSNLVLRVTDLKTIKGIHMGLF